MPREPVESTIHPAMPEKEHFGPPELHPVTVPMIRETLPNIYHGHRVDAHFTTGHGTLYSVYGEPVETLGVALDLCWKNRYQAPPDAEIEAVLALAKQHENRPVYWTKPKPGEKSGWVSLSAAKEAKAEAEALTAEQAEQAGPAAKDGPVTEQPADLASAVTDAASDAIQEIAKAAVEAAKPAIQAAAAEAGVNVKFVEDDPKPEAPAK